MRIAHITTYPSPGEVHADQGGVASYAKQLLPSIPYRADDQISVFAEAKTEGPLAWSEGALHASRNWRRGARYPADIWRSMRREQPDILHLQQEIGLFGPPAGSVFLPWLLRGLQRGSKVVVTVHGLVDPAAIDKAFVASNHSSLPPSLVRAGFRAIYGPLGRVPDRVIVHEERFRSLLISRYGGDASRIKVVPHGIETGRALPKHIARRALGITDDAHVALFMGYATGYKGLGLLIDGFAAYLRQDPKAYLIIGAGRHPRHKGMPAYESEYERLKERARTLLGKSHRWVGFVEEKDMPAYYGAADLSIFPYTMALASSGPMSLSIGFGTPFLASEAFEGIFDRDVLFPRSIEGVAAGLSNFFRDPHYFRQLAERLREERSWRVVGAQTYAVYEELYAA